MHLLGKEFLQCVGDLKIGVPQARAELLFQLLHKFFKLLGTNLQHKSLMLFLLIGEGLCEHQGHHGQTPLEATSQKHHACCLSYLLS